MHSPDLQPATEDASATAMPPHPTPLRNVGFWLLAMLLGLVLMLLLAALTASGEDKNSGVFSLGIAGLATILSLVAMPLLPPLSWALMAPSAGLRWLRIFTLQSLSLGGLTGVSYVMAGGSGSGGFGMVAPVVGTVYSGAGLLAAMVVYRAWLFRH